MIPVVTYAVRDSSPRTFAVEPTTSQQRRVFNLLISIFGVIAFFVGPHFAELAVRPTSAGILLPHFLNGLIKISGLCLRGWLFQNERNSLPSTASPSNRMRRSIFDQ